jgi:hypothetical protein
LTERSTKPSDLIQIGIGVISAALGLAVAASGIGRTVVAVVTWTVVAAGMGMIVVGGLRLRARRRPRAAPPLTEPRLSDRLISLGTRITAFKQDRDAQAPQSSNSESQFLHPIRASRARQTEAMTLAAYDDDTLSLYHHRFSREAWIIVRDLLLAGAVGDNEAQSLVSPEHVEDIEWIGMRLTELGARQPARYRPVA